MKNKYQLVVEAFVKKAQAGKRMSPMLAIRARCLDCCGYQSVEVARCPVKDCPLWLFRSGKNTTGGKNRKDSEDYDEDMM